VSQVDPAILQKLHTTLGLSPRRIQELIAQIAGERHLTRQQAAIVLASERGVNVARLASPEDLAAIRGTTATSSSMPAPVPPVSVPTGGLQRASRQSGRKNTAARTSRRRGNSVFVVHGRNEAIRRALFQFLRAVGLNPIEWRKAIELTGKPSPYVGEILDAAFRHAVAVVVLFTPDDEARLKSEFLNRRDRADERELTGQARPNVLFEAGMAFGRNPDATVLVQVGELRSMSDIAGRHIVHLTNAAESRQELVIKLANAGCNVATEGKTDWLSEGDFAVD